MIRVVTGLGLGARVKGRGRARIRVIQPRLESIRSRMRVRVICYSEGLS